MLYLLAGSIDLRLSSKRAHLTTDRAKCQENILADSAKFPSDSDKRAARLPIAGA
jgi:hypothetical protein